MSRVETVKGQPIYWFDGKTPKKTIVGDDGIPVTIKMTAKPWRPFINGVGTVYQLGLTAAAADRNIHGANAVAIVRRKLNAGHVPADECPVVTGRLPMGLRLPGDTPCKDYVSREGAPLTRPKDPPCIHAQRIIEARAKVHNEKEARLARAYESQATADQREMLKIMMKREEREARQVEAAAVALEGKRK